MNNVLQLYLFCSVPKEDKDDWDWDSGSDTEAGKKYDQEDEDLQMAMALSMSEDRRSQGTKSLKCSCAILHLISFFFNKDRGMDQYRRVVIHHLSKTLPKRN